MPKRIPDEVISVRLELQDKERQILVRMIQADTVKGIADSIDKLASFENLYVLATILEIVTGKEILPGTPNDIYQLIDWLRDSGKSIFRDPGNPDASLWEAFWDVDLQRDWERFFGGGDDDETS